MSKVSEFLVDLVLPAAEELEKESLDDVLQDLHDSNADDYKATIFAAHALAVRFQPVLDKSKSKVLKGIVGALFEEINESAEKNGIAFEA